MGIESREEEEEQEARKQGEEQTLHFWLSLEQFCWFDFSPMGRTFAT